MAGIVGEKSSKVIEGTITEARKFLKLHEADRIKDIVSKPSKKTIKEAFDDWNHKGEDTDGRNKTNAKRQYSTSYYGIFWRDSHK